MYNSFEILLVKKTMKLTYIVNIVVKSV